MPSGCADPKVDASGDVPQLWFNAAIVLLGKGDQGAHRARSQPALLAAQIAEGH